jgi:glycosyltransferase involved in cell wall biosynthesis
MDRLIFVMPLYNGARHLREAIASLLQQRARVVCVDDGSTDDSVVIARACGVEVVPSSQHLGLAGNWNRCLELVTTELFVLAHQDDVYEPDYAATMLPLIDAHPRAFIAHCKTVSIDGEGRTVSTPAAAYKESLWPREAPYEHDAAAELAPLARGNFIVAPSVIFRTAAVRRIGPFSPLQFVTDWEYWFRGLLAGYTIAGTHKRLLRFRRHEGTATRATERTMDRYREEIALQRWLATKAKIEPRYTTVTRILLSEIAAALAAGERERASELLDFARREVPRFPARLAGLAVRGGKLGGRAMLAAQAVALRLS